MTAVEEKCLQMEKLERDMEGKVMTIELIWKIMATEYNRLLLLS